MASTHACGSASDDSVTATSSISTESLVHCQSGSASNGVTVTVAVPLASMAMGSVTWPARLRIAWPKSSYCTQKMEAARTSTAYGRRFLSVTCLGELPGADSAVTKLDVSRRSD